MKGEMKEPILDIMVAVPVPLMRTSVGNSSLEYRKMIWKAAEMVILPIITNVTVSQVMSGGRNKKNLVESFGFLQFRRIMIPSKFARSFTDVCTSSY